MENKRSVGVTILGSINRTLFGFVMLLFPIVIFFLSFNNDAFNHMQSPVSLSVLRIFCLYLIVLSACFIITGKGILELKEIARIRTIYLAIVMVVINLIQLLFSPTNMFSVKFLLELISYLFYPCLLLYFFTRPKVKAQFSPERCEPDPKVAI